MPPDVSGDAPERGGLGHALLALLRLLLLAHASSALAGCAGEPTREPTKRAAQTRAGLRGQNAQTAATLGVTAIADAAPAGLGLDGAGVRVGVWDDAHARDSHVDLRGRVLRKDVGGYGEHATHTTATLAGDGTGDPRARGMATATRVWSYDWLLDLVELEAAAPALSLSSHAYGPTLGWSIEPACPAYSTWRGAADAREDAAFGRYGEGAAALDGVVSRTDLLTVWPAGNERADRGPAPGESHYHLGSCENLFTDLHLQETTLERDTLAGLGLAKNALMVGAVRAIERDDLRPERIVPLDVSGFGPTDDGRVKPELVAVGDRVRSASGAADDAYATATGSSSATAAVAGAAALLTQLHRQLNQGADLGAAALKALLVHTAREAGEPGPDVGTGYGLLDAQAAADLLLADAQTQPRARHLLVGSLGPDETLTLQSTTELTADEALRVTLAWLDPPAEPARGDVDDPTATLIDDLDLVVRTPDGTSHLPWSLPLDGGRASNREPNRTDNLELVDVAAATGAREPGALRVSVHAPVTLREDRPRAFALVSSLPLVPPTQPVLLMPRYVEAMRPTDGSRLELRAQLASQDGEAFAFSARALQPWLAVSPASGRVPAELVIEADLDALDAAAEAFGQIMIESDDASGPRVLGVVVRAECAQACDEGVGCGPDPRCGLACGRCEDGELCQGDRCVPIGESCPHGELGAALGVALVTASAPASTGEDSGSCGGDAADERAFAWTPPRDGRYAITTRGGAGGRDTVLYARSGACDGEELACNDDSGSVGSALGLTLTAGERVTLFVDTFADDAREPFALSIEPASCPSVSLGSRLGQGVATGATAGGIDFLHGSCGGEGSEEARFAWTAPYASRFRFALFQPRYQAVLYLRDGDCDGDELSCSFATDVGPVEVSLAAGQTVVVVVDGREGRSGPFTLDIVDTAFSCEGSCGDAIGDGRCACDARCVGAGDCCADACERCGACRCERSCDGRRCGPDGCGGECGACGAGLRCDDGACVPDPCEGVACEACETCQSGRCVALPDGAACEDGDACTVLDRCERGACAGDARDCDDGFACTQDGCDTRSGRCVSHELSACCDGDTGCGAMSLADGGAVAPKDEGDGGGCGCRLAPSSSSPGSLLGAALSLLAAPRLRRRARSALVCRGGRIGEVAG